MRTPSVRSVRPALLALLTALGAPACALPATPDASRDPGEQLGTSVAAITAADAIARAELWSTAKLLYCQSPNGADDSIDPACSPICNRQSNPQWDPYRSDCSGLVSWAWGLPAPGRTTAELAPNQSDITKVIQASTLAMGDAVNTDDSAGSEHHVMLFKAWTIPGQEATFIEEPGCSATPNYAHEFTSTVTLAGTSITVHYNGITFKAIRYGALTASSTYAASYVAQSWPLSSAPAVAMTVGQTQKGSIDLKNTGTATWAAGVVKLAPIPRDQPSPFQASSWLSPTRVSTLAQDVPPGSTGHFEWDLDPAQPGSFMPYFGLVADGITWFADSGGPPDDDMQVNLEIAPAPPTSSSSAGAGGSSGTGGSSGRGGGGGAETAGAGGATSNPGTHAGGGCQIDPGGSSSRAGVMLLAGLLLARRRRRVAG